MLNSLTPPPTGTNGTIAYTINTISETELKRTRTTSSAKTGGATVEYLLKVKN